MSEVKVNKITPRTDCGTTQLGDSGDTVTVTGDLRSDSLKAADGGVIISQSGTTITLGASGDTVSLASGASQSGFGRSGSVDWQTTVKTESFTASSGEGYFIDTADSGSPFKNYAVTVATGTQYIVGGSGNVFNLDGSQQTAITLMKGKTYRFTQTDNTNDGHPLIISTSNSTTLSTFIAGIVSSGVSYYLDGSSNQSSYVNTTSFNAATTRYIEFQPQSTGTFYFGCYIHGIGMGGAITSENVTVSLPAGVAGAIIAVKDYGGTFDTNAVVLSPNGSDKIGGSALDSTLSTEGTALTLVFVDSTQGWLVTNDGSQSEAPTPAYIAATGGTITTVCTNFKVHTFTGPGTFCVSSVGNASGSNTVDYLVVAGGGGGGFPGNMGYETGGGGAGGYRESGGTASGCYSVSPLGSSPSSVAALPVSVTGYPITVGAGATAGGSGTTCVIKYPGNPSVFSTITSAAGGGGGSGGSPEAGKNGDPGGSGGGGNYAPGGSTGGTGNTPPVSPPQGQPGGNGNSPPTRGGGGGGATEAGTPYNTPPTNKAAGGVGATSSITGSAVGRAGGGNGGNGTGTNANPFGGGTCAGTANTGGGGAGVTGGPPTTGKNGGSGIVIIRYKFQG